MRSRRIRRLVPPAALVAAAAAIASTTQAGVAAGRNADPGTATPIKHLVVIFQENVSFDHYFATYPVATNPAGEPPFVAKPGTPSVNGLNESLMAPNNPNLVQPFRLDRAQAQTSDQDHGYLHEQQAYDGGLLDQFVEKTGRGTSPDGTPGGQVMGYYDGNTVTALWNYAQDFAMSDNSFDTNFGPSSPGAINLVSGETHGFTGPSYAVSASSQTLYSDTDPAYDKCSSGATAAAEPGNPNIGDLLSQANVTWGWFEGGFRDCAQTHTNVGGVTSKDYIPHHEPFQYYASTANPQHLPPTSTALIGHNGDQANHQYDLTDFWAAVDAGNMPSVSFLKAPAYQDGHAGYSDPLDEQTFLVDTINRLEKTPYWQDTAVVIAYDDSDGWYDHVMPPIVNQSQDPAHDGLYGATCGSEPMAVAAGYQTRCGYGPRQPLLVISPYAKSNYVDHTVTDQSSILRFIEDNWLAGERIGPGSFDSKAGTLLNMFSFQGSSGQGGANKLFLDPQTGEKQ